MKRLLLLALIAIVGTPVFADTWLSLGGGYTFNADFSGAAASRLESMTSSLGPTFSLYAFRGMSNFGLFFKGQAMFPIFGTVTVGSTTPPVSSFDFIMGGSMLLGPALRLFISDLFDLYMGVGPQMKHLSAGGLGSTLLSWSLGVGSDVGMRINITPRLAVNVGTTFAYYPDRYEISNAAGVPMSGWTVGYSSFNVGGYIALGLSLGAMR